MLKGREIHVLAVDGQLRLCTCCLDRKLKHMSIEMNGLERKAQPHAGTLRSKSARSLVLAVFCIVCWFLHMFFSSGGM